jgi:hypothetical protein
VTLTGNCIYRNLSVSPALESPVGGVTVTVTVTEDLPGLWDLQAASPVVVQTNANGNYTATIAWSRGALYVPPENASANGGDTLVVTVDFLASGYTFPSAVDTSILSWSANNIVNGVDTVVP